MACQTCHIPTFSRTQATKVEWYWDEAGEDRTDIPTEFGKPTYDKKKGSFVWDMNVSPTYLWYDGMWTRKVLNVTDTYDEAGTEADPIVLAAPDRDFRDGRRHDLSVQEDDRSPAGRPGSTSAWWFRTCSAPPAAITRTGVEYDWGLAIEDGTTYVGQEYSGEYDFANTVMYLTINHEVAPKESALDCGDCHGNEAFWTQVGLEDPFAD